MENELKEKDSVLIWNIENINYKRIDEIYEKLSFIPKKQFIITHYKLSSKILKALEPKGFKFLYAPKDADTSIIKVLKLIMETNKFLVIISSDSDFVNITQELTNKHKKVHLILDSHNSKRSLFKNNISEQLLKISLIGNKF